MPYLAHAHDCLAFTGALLQGTAATLTVGRDLLNIGGALQAGNNATLTAGRDLAIAAAVEVDSGQSKPGLFIASTTPKVRASSSNNLGV